MDENPKSDGEGIKIPETPLIKHDSDNPTKPPAEPGPTNNSLKSNQKSNQQANQNPQAENSPGRFVIQAEEEGTYGATQQNPSGGTEEDNLQQKSVGQGGGKSGGKVITIVVSMLLVLILVVAGYLYLINNKGKEQTQEQPPQEVQTTDTDADTLPDSLEEVAGLSPTRSEFDRCASNSPCLTGEGNKEKKKHNLYIALGLSSTMQLPFDTTTKFEAAKEAANSLITLSIDGVTTQSGLAIFGHEGSDDEEDKEISCNSIEVVNQLGEFTAENPTVELTNEPTGWRPIGNLLETIGNEFVDPGSINEIVIITDGTDNCDTDPALLAQTIKDGGLNISTHVIGLDIPVGQTQELSSVATSGGGIFINSENSNELQEAVAQVWGESQKRLNADICTQQDINDINQCIFNTVKTLNDYAFTQEKEQSHETLDYINLFSKYMYEQLNKIKGNVVKNLNSQQPQEL